MSRTIKIAVIATDITTSDIAVNLDRAHKAIETLPREVDVIVLPELFATGLPASKEDIARVADNTEEHRVIDALADFASAKSAAVCASLLWRVDREGAVPEYENMCVFIEPGGEATYYAKGHLFCRSQERNLLVAGTMPPPVIRFRGCNFSISVCYDLRFPAWLRNNVQRPYDIMLVPANWPQSRAYAWEMLLKTRAMENQAIFVGANCNSSDDGNSYDAMSLISDAKGCKTGNYIPGEQTIIAEVDIDELHKFRKSFPVLDDADKFSF